VGLLAVAARVVAAYLVLLALLRFSGKRTVRQGEPFDFVLALVLGDMVDDLLWAEVGMGEFTVAAGTLLLGHTAMAMAQRRSCRLHRWVCGAPAVVLDRGRVDAEALARERVHPRELEGLLRLRGIERARWPDVRVMRIETGGVASVLKEQPAQPLERREAAEKGA
jgi:uncharacterized membrane protein YcaP (DUF421 family)